MWPWLIKFALDKLPNFVVGFIPRQEGIPEWTYWWCWRSVFCSAATGAIGALGLALAFNLLPVPPTYALAGDLIQTNATVKANTDRFKSVDEKLQQLLAQNERRDLRDTTMMLIDARRQQCRIIAAGDRSALPFWASRIEELKQLYYAQSHGQPWEPMDCRSF